MYVLTSHKLNFPFPSGGRAANCKPTGQCWPMRGRVWQPLTNSSARLLTSPHCPAASSCPRSRVIKVWQLSPGLAATQKICIFWIPRKYVSSNWSKSASSQSLILNFAFVMLDTIEDLGSLYQNEWVLCCCFPWNLSLLKHLSIVLSSLQCSIPRDIS